MGKAVHAVFAIMTLQAITAILSLMLAHESRIVTSVAGNAGLRIKLTDIAGVASFAGQWLLAVILGVTDQAEASLLGMVEGLPVQAGGLPGLRSVASSAILPEQALVDGGLGVAANALGGGLLKIGDVVAGGAVEVGMLSGQGKDALVMVEVSHAVLPVMTVQALGAEIVQVLAHKGWVVLGMAVLAGIG